MQDVLSTFVSILASRSPWSGFFYFSLGVLITVYITFTVQKPRLIINGGGSGGNQQKHSWAINIINRPTLFGRPFGGEPACDISAWLLLREKDSGAYPVYWGGQTQNTLPILEPGKTQSVTLFAWFLGIPGYYIVDGAGERVAKFDARETKFVLRLNDRLGRATEFPFTVKFDESHLKNMPRLTIIHPASFEQRYSMVRNGFRLLLQAFRR